MSDAILSLSADAGLSAAIARALSADLRPGDVLRLNGPVGAGKSHFARALIRARLGNPAEDVPSPTFTLVQSYEGDPPIWHADLYRLSDPAEIDELGLPDAIPASITLVEWPDRMPESGEELTVDLAHLPDPDLRQISFRGAARWSHLPRAVERAQFANNNGWGEAGVSFLAGDASARRYYRLELDGRRAVLMDADAESLGRYAQMTGWLAENGFDVPEILALDLPRGLALLEDLGDAQVARVIADDPAQAGPLYDRIAQMLAHLAQLPAAPGIPALDGPALADQVGLFQLYPKAAGASAEGVEAASRIGPTIAALHERLCAKADCVTALRDFHAENIILTPDNRLALLDFQDAVATHPAYDLASALHDPRRALPEEVEAAAIARFLSLTGLPEARFNAAFALLSAQRNLRIMGIFTRLCIRDGKPRYLAFMPRCWALVTRAVAHPELASLQELVRQQPAPSADVMERIASQCRR